MGELQKQIKAEMELYDEIVQTPDGDKLLSEVLLAIVAAMTREFPIYYKLVPNDGRVYRFHEIPEDLKENAVPHSVIGVEAMKWFVRWLGADDDPP